MKRKFLLSLILTLATCLLSFTLIACGGGSSNGENSGGENPPEILQGSEGLEYALINNGTEYEVVDIGDCTDTDIVIPSKYKDLPVTSIGGEAFLSCDSLISIEIPDSVTTISYCSFFLCHALESVKIGNGVTSIGNYAFNSCDSLKSVVFGDESKLESIGAHAFEMCYSLETIEIPDSVITIDVGAFRHESGFLIIYCEAESKPSGWNSSWYGGSAEVIWGYKGN